MIGYLQRRRRTAEQGRAQLALGRLRLARGRRPAARVAFEESRRLFDETRDAPGVVLALVHLGAAEIEDGALPSAESVLRMAEVCATHANLTGLCRTAGLLLARCLFWQGRHDESWRLVERLARPGGDRFEAVNAVAENGESARVWPGWWTFAAPCPDPPGVSAVAAEVGVRTALAHRDAALAAKRLAAAGEARDDCGPAHAGTLIGLRLLVQGALGDHAAVSRTAASGLQLMRRLHAPLASQEIRLAHLEALIECGNGTLAAGCLRRFGKRSALARSGLARLRMDALAARLHQLERDGRRRGVAADCTVEAAAVVRILQQCQEAQSDADAVTGVCQSVRTALGAAAVSAFALSGGAMPLVGSAGQRRAGPNSLDGQPVRC